MAITFITCRDYSSVGRFEGVGLDAATAAAICRNIEDVMNDGYSVFASDEGRMVAFGEGPCEPEGGPPYDAATATGMYDREG
jgi:hypothetical protein